MFLLRCKLYSIIKAVWNHIWFILHIANNIQDILLEVIVRAPDTTIGQWNINLWYMTLKNSKKCTYQEAEYGIAQKVSYILIILDISALKKIPLKRYHYACRYMYTIINNYQTSQMFLWFDSTTNKVALYILVVS